MAVKGAERRKRIDAYSSGNYHTSETVSSTGVKIRVHIPDKAVNRQLKINKIYDILVPVTENQL